MAISTTRLAQLRKLIEEAREAEFYSWPEWERTRQQVLMLDHHECVRCKAHGKYSPAVLVHHVNHLKDKPELALSITDENGKRQLVSLCRACHELEHPERLRPAWTAKIENPLTVERWD
jgi:5-methylcytosine-specific restriction endonuclease McrA